MITITLLDGKQLSCPAETTGLELVAQISKSLMKVTYIMYVDGVLTELTAPLNCDCQVEFVTINNKDTLLPIVRHDMAHLLAQAVLILYPSTQLAIGPSTENGFFYDFLPQRPFSLEDLADIEQLMHQLIDAKHEVIKSVVTKQEALAYYRKVDYQPFKLEILESIADETVTFYQQGQFKDLCVGPHVYNTQLIPKAFKLTKVSGVYWKNDAKNPMLQRIYGVGFMSKKELDQFLVLQEELAQNDHRKLGKEMKLFHFQDEAVGNVFWHPNGWRLYRILEDYMRSRLSENGYHEIKTPQIIDQSLWKQSGHWDKFRENIFVVDEDNHDKLLVIKPMNCPAHVQIFNRDIRSYKDLPYKLAEFGCCHRNEPSGSLHGLLRVRSFNQDDAHIFCTEDQIFTQTQQFCNLLYSVYRDIFGQEIDLIVKFADRPAKRAGDDAQWDKAEQFLYQAAIDAGLELITNKGEGAFYGPKLEFVLKDSMGRDWQLGTLQVDFILPQRLNANYIDENGDKQTVVMLHRAILGTFERFIGVLLEHYKGRLPIWLSPIPVVICSIIDSVGDYCRSLQQQLATVVHHSEIDIRNEKINYKIREHILAKIPVIVIIGAKEVDNNQISFRLANNHDTHTVSVDQFIKLLKTNIENKNPTFSL